MERNGKWCRFTYLENRKEKKKKATLINMKFHNTKNGDQYTFKLQNQRLLELQSQISSALFRRISSSFSDRRSGLIWSPGVFPQSSLPFLLFLGIGPIRGILEFHGRKVNCYQIKYIAPPFLFVRDLYSQSHYG
jgi:hypothetical protein